MSNISVGLFDAHSNYKNLELDLENLGFTAEDYIVFLSENSKENEFLASVELKKSDQKMMVEGIFDQHDVLRKFNLDHMSLEEVKSYKSIKSIIDVISKAEIKPSPELHFRKKHDGLDSEVKF